MSTAKTSTTEKALVTRVSTDTIAQIDKLAAATSQSRSQTTAMLIEKALQTIRLSMDEVKKAMARSKAATKAVTTKKATKKAR